MMTEGPVTPTSKENLAWFQKRRERWMKSPRPKLKPLTPQQKVSDVTSLEIVSTTNINTSRDGWELKKSEIVPTTIETSIGQSSISSESASASASASASSIIQPLFGGIAPSQPTSNTFMLPTNKVDMAGSKGNVANMNLVASSSSFGERAPTTIASESTVLVVPKDHPSQPSSFGNETKSSQESKASLCDGSSKTIFGMSSSENSFSFGASNFSGTRSWSTSTNSESTGKDTKTTETVPIIGGSSKSTFGVSSGPSPFSVVGSSNSGTGLIATSKNSESTGKDTKTTETVPLSDAIFGGASKSTFGVSSGPSPFTFGATTTFGSLSLAANNDVLPRTSKTQGQGNKEQDNKATPKPGLLSSDLGSGQNNNHRSRLIAFYEKYNPEKLDSVDSTLEKYKGKENELFSKLEAKYLPNAGSMYPLPSGVGPICFLEFSIDGQVAGKVIVKLFRDKVPLASDNFQALCNGSKGKGRMGKNLCYKYSKVHRVVPLFCVQMGDFTRGDGTGGESIYEPNTHGVSDSMGRFKDETFLQHSKKGLLSMANNGPNRNGSQFFFTLRPCPSLDGKHVVFGEVESGMEVIEKIGHLQTTPNQRPEKSVEITNCGEIIDGKEVSCEVAIENAAAPFSFGTSFGKSETTGFASLASSAKPSSFGVFGAGSNPGSTPFSFGAVAASLQSTGTDNTSGIVGGTSFLPVANKPSAFGFGFAASGQQFGSGSATNLDSSLKSPNTFGSFSMATGTKLGQDSAFSFGSNAVNSSPNPELASPVSPIFELRTKVRKEISDSDESTRNDDEDTDDDE